MANTARGAGVTQPRPVVENIVPSSGWTEDPSGHYLLIDLPGFQKDQVKIQIFNSGLIKVTGERPVNENKHIRFEQDFEVPKYSYADGITAKFDGEILYVIVPKHKVEEKKEPEPKKEPESKKEPEPKKEHEPPGVKDQIVNGAAKYQNMCEKPKDKEAKKKDDKSKKEEESRQKAPVSLSEDSKKRWEGEPSFVNGAAKDQNMCEKPKDKEAKKKDDKSKKEEGSRQKGPVSLSENSEKRWEGEPSYLRRVMDTLSRNKGIVVTTVLAVSLGIFISRTFKAKEE